MGRTPQECFENHLQALHSGDVEKIAADYTDDAIHITHGVVRRGKDGVEDAFAQLLSTLSAAGEIKALEIPIRAYGDDILFIEWSADFGHKRCDGIDTFVFQEGLIRVQTLHYKIKPTG